ncbi:MAG: zinc-dependent alcohol dehydrogenase [Ilumatobacteraceae bacterium]
MRALSVQRSVPRFGAARLISTVSARSATRVGPLTLGEIDDPDQPGPGWERIDTVLSGICGSDLALADGRASAYFEDWVSFPFVPGHEVVGRRDDGSRVVIEPVLGHAARGAVPPSPEAAPADGDDYRHLVTGPLEPGIQTGFCNSTGGGWAPWFWAHESQLHAVPDGLSDEAAVLVEPLAGGVHAAFSVRDALRRADLLERGPLVVGVLGAGTMGLATVAALRAHVPEADVVVGARYPHQFAIARALGAAEVVRSGDLAAAIRRRSGSHVIGRHLSSGAHCLVDAVGSSDSIAESISMTRPRGRVVLLGMPADISLDMTPLWHRETELRGCYTYGTEILDDGTAARTFSLAIDLALSSGAERLLSATYPIERHVDALAHAAEAGRRGAVKIAFDLRRGN